MAVAIASTFQPAKKRRLLWTCRYCGHTFRTWTRAGLRVTCKNPSCGRVQEGPAGIERLAERLGKLQAPKRPKAQTLAVVAAPKPTPKVIAKTGAGASSSVTERPGAKVAGAGSGRTPAPRPTPPAAPAPSTPKQRAGLVDRLFFGVHD